MDQPDRQRRIAAEARNESAAGGLDRPRARPPRSRIVPEWGTLFAGSHRRFICNPVKRRERRLNAFAAELRTRSMRLIQKLLPPIALVGTLALVPVTASSL